MALEPDVCLSEIEQAKQSQLKLLIGYQGIELVDMPFAEQVERVYEELELLDVELVEILRRPELQRVILPDD